MNIEQLLSRLVLVLVLLCGGLPLAAQMPTFFVEDAVALPEEEVRVNVRIINPSMVTGIQFSLNWNDSQLNFLGVDNIALNGTYDGNFNQTKVDSGRVGFILVDQSLNPLQLVDSAVLFTMRFEPIPNTGFSSVIGFGDSPVTVRAGNTDGDRVPVDTLPGQIDLQSLAALEVVSENARFRASPNPFRDRVRLELRGDYTGPALLEVLSADGRTVLRRTISLRADNDSFTLPAADFPSAGSYIVRVTTDREQFHRKVLFGSGGR